MPASVMKLLCLQVEIAVADLCNVSERVSLPPTLQPLKQVTYLGVILIPHYPYAYAVCGRSGCRHIRARGAGPVKELQYNSPCTRLLFGACPLLFARCSPACDGLFAVS